LPVMVQDDLHMVRLHRLVSGTRKHPCHEAASFLILLALHQLHLLYPPGEGLRVADRGREREVGASAWMRGRCGRCGVRRGRRGRSVT
jgi:hypothetical protein